MNIKTINKIIKESIDEFLNEEQAYDKLQKLEKWFKEEQEKLDKVRDFKKWKFKSDVLYRTYYREKEKLNKFNNLYGLAGDKNVKYIYHYTNIEGLLGIVSENMLIGGGDEYGGISFTSNPNLYKRGFVFMYGSRDIEGRDYKNSGVKIKFDFNKLKERGYKFRTGTEDIGTHSGEEELRLKQDELPHVSDYIVEVIIIGSKERNNNMIRTAIQYMDKLNIKYKLA